MVIKSEIKYVVVACCTYKRPKELERLLNNLLGLNYPDGIKTDILIVDNDIEQSAKQVCEKFSDQLNIKYTNEEKKGFANVRNKALEESINLGATHIAFIDDDEIADENWLVNHIDFYNRFEEIYISSGPTIKLFSGDCPEYIRHNKLFSTSKSKKSGDLKSTCASGNVFFPLDIIGDLRFNEDFNTSGSEDTEFFFKLNSLGYKIGWNNEAVNYEIVNESRTNIKYIITRAFANGFSNSYIKISKEKHLNYCRISYILKKLLAIVSQSIALILMLPLGFTKFFNNISDISKNTGKLWGAVKYSPKYKLYYYYNKPNAGDTFNKDLLKFFNIKYKPVKNIDKANLLCVGSNLDKTFNNLNNQEKIIVAGAGFTKEPNIEETSNRQFVIKSLRGKYSKNNIEKITGKSIECPLGDPGILASYMFPVNIEKKYNIGIIPHYTDKKYFDKKSIQTKKYTYRIIDIQKDLKQVLKEINSCELILSSSLHGLIFADSYNIPNQRIIISDRIIGGDYKYKDYYSAFDMDIPKVTDLRKEIITDEKIDELKKMYKSKDIESMQSELVKVYQNL